MLIHTHKWQPVRELPENQLAQEQEPSPRTEQEYQEIQEKSRDQWEDYWITVVIPQLDGPARTGLSDIADRWGRDKEPEPVVF